MQTDSNNHSQALQSLYNAGGHFVICSPTKRPIWRGWQKVRPSLDVVQGHDGPLGIKPWSVSTSALDVDHGSPTILIEDHPPLAVVPSRRPGGTHVYYNDTVGRGNAHFEVAGCSGEVRSAKGYLILWNHGAEILADALEDPLRPTRSWPVDLFDLSGVGPVTVPEMVTSGTISPKYKPTPESRQRWSAKAEDAAQRLVQVQEGRRNVSLFDAVRFWVYAVPSRGTDLDGWNRRVLVQALELNRRFPDPLPVDEVRQTAYSISTWCWSGGGSRWHKLDHSSEAQRRRGLKLGRIRRKGTPLEHDREPWKAEGVSRRTWYRKR